MAKTIALTDAQYALLLNIMERTMDPDMTDIDDLLNVVEPLDDEDDERFEERIEEQTELLHSLNKVIREG